MFMPMDGVFLHYLIDELSPKITNGKIRKINQVDKYSVLLSVRANNENQNLLISSNSKYNGIILTNKKYEANKNNFMFSVILKKYILNGSIKNIYQINNDRLIKIDIENSDELGDKKSYELIIELMGKHSNISLVEKDSQKVLDSIKHLSLNNNSYRTLMPGTEYILPPKDDIKLNPFEVDFHEFRKVINVVDNDEKMFSKIFEGVSLQLSRFIFSKICNESLENKYEVFKTIIKDSKISPVIYKLNNSYKDYYFFDINITDDTIKFDSLTNLMEEFIVTKTSTDNLNSKISNITRVVTSTIQKLEKKIKIFESSLKESKDKDKFKLYADLISSNIYMLKGNEKSLTVQNYFSEDLEEISIPLNPKLNGSQNIEQYYKKFKKLKKSEEINKQNILECTREIDYLNSVLINLNETNTEDDLNEIRCELSEIGYLKSIKSKNKNEIIKSVPYHYATSNGVDIYVGKNNIQNETLTFKTSKKDFTWFHAKNIPGSHVILCHNNPSDKLIEIAAQLAAFYSKASSSSNVPVDYTKVKNIKKMPHAKPGMVIYTSYNTAYVTPPQSIEELKLITKN